VFWATASAVSSRNVTAYFIIFIELDATETPAAASD